MKILSCFSMFRLLATLMAAVVVVVTGCSSSDSSVSSSTPVVNLDINLAEFTLPVDIDNSYDTSAITSFLSSDQVINDTGGGLALILIKDGKLVYRRGFGSFEHDINKVVSVASATKWIAAGVVARLLDAGLYGLEDRVVDYYPYFNGVSPTPILAPDDFVHDARFEDITIAQLFSHTAGLRHLPGVHRDSNLPSIQYAVSQIYFTVPMEHDPGTTVHYAGVGMQIVGGISEIVTQKSWVDIFMDELANPLGMTSTDYYGYVNEAVITTDNPDVAGSIRTNIDDYMRYLYMIYNNGMFDGDRILSEESVYALTHSFSDELPVARTPFEAYFGAVPSTMFLETGFGNWLFDDADGNPLFIVSGGAWGCMPFIDFKHDLVGIYLPFNTASEYDADTRLSFNPATQVFLEDLRPLLDQVFSN